MDYEGLVSEEEPVIRVIGVGGAGGIAINNMKKMARGEVTTAAVDTDKEDLDLIRCDCKILMGKHGSDNELETDTDTQTAGKAAMESEGTIKGAIGKADIVFLVVGLGGKTGTGLSPVISRIAREVGALTVAIVTMPFSFEGEIRSRRANNGLFELKETSDCIFPIFNDQLRKFSNSDVTLKELFEKSDESICWIFRGISGLLHGRGLISLDLEHVKAIIKMSGFAKFGTGIARGVDKARNAAIEAIGYPIFEGFSLKKTRIVLVNITTGKDVDIAGVDQAMQWIYAHASKDTNISYGHIFDGTFEDEMRVSVILMGIQECKIRVAEYRRLEMRELFRFP